MSDIDYQTKAMENSFDETIDDFKKLPNQVQRLWDIDSSGARYCEGLLLEISALKRKLREREGRVKRLETFIIDTYEFTDKYIRETILLE